MVNFMVCGFFKPQLKIKQNPQINKNTTDCLKQK